MRVGRDTKVEWPVKNSGKTLPVNILLVSIGLSYVSQPGVPVIFNFVPEILIRPCPWLTVYKITGADLQF